MKKVVIGIALLINGIILNSFLIQTAMQYLPHMTAWSTSYPSKLFFLIFAGMSKFTDGADGLGLAVPFIFGTIMAIMGFIILIVEYFKKDK